MIFAIEVDQSFLCTYIVEADSKAEAWAELMDGRGECQDQIPGAIIDSLETAEITEEPSL